MFVVRLLYTFSCKIPQLFIVSLQCSIHLCSASNKIIASECDQSIIRHISVLISAAMNEHTRDYTILLPSCRAQAHSVQRSNFVDDTSYYQTSSKMGMRSKAKW